MTSELAMTTSTPRALWAACATALLSACASYGPPRIQPGQPAELLKQSMGVPTGRYALPQQATRLEYARGPLGKHTYMVDVDAAGRVAGWQQVLTEANFATVTPGEPGDELLQRLGRPSERRGGGWQGGEVWSYRYDAVFCQWFQVSVIDDRVKDSAYAPDPLCDADDNERSRRK
jgi:hypothetical protein